MIEAAEQALANFQHEQAMAQTHQRRADGYLAQFLSLVGQTSGDRPTGQRIRCVREWTRWLSENGPEIKSTIQEETGVRFTERGTPHTFLWDESMDPEDDGAYPANALMRIQGPAQPVGRPPMVYFLWSQRWDVHPRFGVGPTQKTAADYADEIGEVGFTGVVRPPKPEFPTDPAYGQHEPFPFAEATADSGEREAAIEPEPIPRCADMDEWDRLHAAYFDGIVQAERKPTDEEKVTLRDTLPLGAEPNAALAIAYRAAVERARGS